jgi:hypothetical protein
MYKSYLNDCVWQEKNCGKKKIINSETQKDNFYVRYFKKVIKDKDKIDNFKLFNCDKCRCNQYSPWFDSKLSKYFYSNGYGQHHKGWLNLKNYFSKNQLPNYLVFNNVISKLRVKKYAEFNCPFTGVFLNFFVKELKINYKQLKKYFNLIIKLNSLKQNAFLAKTDIKKNNIDVFKYLKKYQKFQESFIKKSTIKKYLIKQPSSLIWGQNCNHKSINCHSMSKMLFNIDEIDINDALKKNFKFDLVGFFLTLDHSFKPSEALNFSINKSKYVLIYNHIYPETGKQHYFTLTSAFNKYLEKRKIFVFDLKTYFLKKKIINKNYYSNNPYIYYLCTKNKKDYLNIKKRFR